MADLISNIAKTPKQKTIIWLFIALGILLFILLLGGKLFRNLKKAETITVWGVNLSQANFEQLTNSFKASGANVKIDYTEKDIDTYEDDLNSALLGGTPPDIFMINNAWVGKYKDIIVPLDLTTDKDYNLKKLEDEYPTVIQTDLVEKNNLYGAPISIDTLALYYNRNFLDQAGIALKPQTWGDLVNVLSKLRVVDQYKRIQRAAIPLGLADNVNYATDILALLMLQKGASIVNMETRNIDIDTFFRTATGTIIPGEEALNFYTQFAKPGTTMYTWNSSLPNSLDAFAFGQSVFYIGYARDKKLIEEKNPNLVFGVEAIPQFDLNNKITFSSYYNFVVSKRSENIKSSWELIKHLMGDPIQYKFLQITSLPPAKRTVINNCGNDPFLITFCQNILTAKSYYRTDYVIYEKVFKDMINEVMVKSFTPKTAITNAKEILQYTLYKK